MAITVGIFQAVDPALYGLESGILRPACAALMGYPDKPLPAGLRLAPELAASYPIVSRDRRTYTFVIRRGIRFSTGARLTARDVSRALERIFDPRMKSGNAGLFQDIVGARQMLAGKTNTITGVIANGRTLRLKLTRPVPDFLARTSLLCAVPSSLPADPEGAKAPLPSPAPYFVSEFVPGDRLVLERNRFYRGGRAHHVDRITVDLQGDASAVDDVASGKLDFVVPTPNLSARLAGLARRYGVNRARLFVESDALTRMFLINTTRPLFRNNLSLRQALNFAVDRRALAREFGPYAATPTDHYLPPVMPGFRNERIYPLAGPNLGRARALASGRTGAGRAVLYTCSDRPDCIALAQIFQQNLRAIGLEVRIRQFPLELMFQKLSTPREPYDLAYVGFVAPWNDPELFLGAFRGGAIENWTHLNEPRINRLLDRAAGLSGPARYRAYGDLDVQLVRDATPAVAVLNTNAWSFLSARVGCVVMNPSLDLTAVCLK
jgi:peptide/nickel transport system substrate-binding protein/oligopeptide transport system substrate-binding protein